MPKQNNQSNDSNLDLSTADELLALKLKIKDFCIEFDKGLNRMHQNRLTIQFEELLGNFRLHSESFSACYYYDCVAHIFFLLPSGLTPAAS